LHVSLCKAERSRCSITTELLLGFVAELAETLTKPLVIVVDNASIHHARAIEPALRLLEKKGCWGVRAISWTG
jgi:hypothetical protein